MAKDSSGNGNDLPLVTPPMRQDVTISQVGTSGLCRRIPAAAFGEVRLSSAEMYVQILHGEEKGILLDYLVVVLF